MSTRSTGQRAEDYVVSAAERRGLRVVERNVEVGGGELDLICQVEHVQPPLFVFVEVRSRASSARGRPEETVGPRKQAKLLRAATAWLVARGLWERVGVRFDVVGVTGDQHDLSELELEWIEAAFEAG